MPNTVTQRTLAGDANSRLVIRQIQIISDGSEETDLVIYDNSAFQNDVNSGSVVRIQATGSDCICRLEWDQTTDAPIASFSPINNPDLCLMKLGGISNPGATGATGDILLSTSGLDSGDEVTIIIYIRQ